MISALNWAMRLTTEVITTHEKLVLIALADVSDFLYITKANKTKILKFTCLTDEELNDALESLENRGFIKKLSDTDHRDTLDEYKLIVSF